MDRLCTWRYVLVAFAPMLTTILAGIVVVAVDP
jgi:hypothetical protein